MESSSDDGYMDGDVEDNPGTELDDQTEQHTAVSSQESVVASQQLHQFFCHNFLKDEDLLLSQATTLQGGDARCSADPFECNVEERFLLFLFLHISVFN